MSVINTSNVDSLVFQMQSIEAALKQNIEQQKKTVENFIKAQKDKLESAKSLNKKLADGSILPEEYQKKIKEVDDNLNQIYHRSPTPDVQKGKNGSIVAKHKNKLGFIFIGDTLNAEENDLFNVNSPKITLAVGGALETSFDPFKNNPAFVDPREEFIPQASAQIHLISSSDIDVEGIAAESAFRNKSAVKIRSDVLDFSANQAVIIRSLNTPYIAGVRSYSPGGVHIVSGNKEAGGEYKDPEPMVLGNSLSNTLIEMMKIISELASIVNNINNGLINLKQVLGSHTHLVQIAPPPAPPIPTLLSPEINVYNTITAITEDLLNTGNIYSNMLNMEIKKLNDLMEMSPKSFTSKFNRVN